MGGIRVEANDVIATGHIMRCITIAKQIKKLGKEVLFFLADNYGTSILEENGFNYVILHTDWRNPMEETVCLSQEIEHYGIQILLFDSYKITKEYFYALKQRLSDNVKMAYIDDLFEDVYPVEIIINYNAYHSRFPYAETYADLKNGISGGKECDVVDTKLCLGPQFVPLREEFGNKELSDEVEESVLLSCGGGDSLQAIHGILEKAIKDTRFSNTMFHVVVGRYHQKRELLETIAASNDNVILHYNVKEMAELMKKAEVAVSAAGTMLYELAAMERPTVFFITADNQRYDSSFFAEEKRMIFAGDIRTDRENCIRHILDGMHELLSNIDICMEMKEKLRRITDGKGAQRIAEELIG